MAPGLQRTSFNSSRLIRLLSDLSAAEPVAGSAPSLAGRLGSWLEWTDSIALAAAARGGEQLVLKTPAFGLAKSARAAADELGHVRAALVAGITAFDGLDDRLAADEPPVAPLLRHCTVQQRAMEAAIGPLRASVRATLKRSSPALGRLAAMDAVLDAALLTRERHLLAKVPALLERHFRRLWTAQADQPAGQTAAWQAAVRRSLQEALLAELEHRLQPVQGLVDALGAVGEARP